MKRAQRSAVFRTRLRFAEIDHGRSPTESSGGNTDINESNQEPDTADYFRERVQVPPDQPTKDKATERQHDIGQHSSPLANAPMDSELPEGCEVHSHEGEKRAEVKKLTRVLVRISNRVKEHRANKRQSADDEYVVRRCAASGAQVSEEAARQHVVASHAEKQAGRPEPAGQTAAESCQYKNRAHGIEEDDASDALADIHEGGFQIGERVPVRPNHLREIDEQPAKNAGEDAYKHGCQQDVALGILNVFSKSCDSIEADVGKSSKRRR